MILEAWDVELEQAHSFDIIPTEKNTVANVQVVVSDIDGEAPAQRRGKKLHHLKDCSRSPDILVS